MQGQTNKTILDRKLQRTLRSNRTGAEKKLWRNLRSRQFDGCKFRRQHPFENYILDFVCLDKKLIVEVDGGQHSDTVRSDQARTAFLEKGGFTVLRFWNHEVMAHIEAVKASMWSALHDDETNPSPPRPSP